MNIDHDIDKNPHTAKHFITSENLTKHSRKHSHSHIVTGTHET